MLWNPLLVIGIVLPTVIAAPATAIPSVEAKVASFRQDSPATPTTEALVEESTTQPIRVLESDGDIAQALEEAEAEAEPASRSSDEAEADSPEVEAEAEEAESPEEIARREKLAEADRLHQAGETAAAAQLYREAKEPFELEAEADAEQPEAIYEPANLPPGGAVYWRQYQTGREEKLESKILAPLELLVEQYPEFIPGHIQYAQALTAKEQEEEAQAVLREAIALYPTEVMLLKAKLQADADAERWLDASLAARQFALFNPDHSQSAEFEQLADQYLEEYKSDLRSDMTWNTVGSVITGALSYALTGNLFGPLSAIETTALLLQGESGIGDRYAESLQKQLPLVEDEEVLEYVRGIGNELAEVAGRDEFEYEFFIVLDDRLNAFALPGGKIFIHTGAIEKAESEAELAGLLAHELAHAVLSHGFQLVTQGNLTANVAQFIPYGGTAANLLVLDYSRGMEKEADLLGTQILAASGYAADGLHNLMATLAEEDKPTPFVWLSTHPDSEQRVEYLEEFIVANEYNRYTFEGITRHRQIQDKVSEIWEEYKESEEYKERQNRRR